MAEYDNTNRGVLFSNDRKQNDKQPDYRGTLDVNGVQHQLSGWIKTSKKGTKFLSLQLTPPAPTPKDDEDIPF